MLDAQRPTRRAPERQQPPSVRSYTRTYTANRFRWCVLCEYHACADAGSQCHAISREKPAISREFSCAKLQPRLISRLCVIRQGGDDDFRHLRLPLTCQSTAAAASYHDQPAVELNSGVCTRHILEEGSIDVSNWESFLHCRAYGSRENGVLIKARINIEIK